MIYEKKFHLSLAHLSVLYNNELTVSNSLQTNGHATVNQKKEKQQQQQEEEQVLHFEDNRLPKFRKSFYKLFL